MRRPRLVRWVAYGVAALLVIVTGLLVLGDWLIDRPVVKAAIQQRLSAALGGQIAWEGLVLRLLPAPHGELHRVRVEIPGAFTLRAEEVDAYLRLWPLLRGEPEIASLSAQRPEIRIEAGGGGGEKGKTEPVQPLVAYERAMAPTVRALQRFAPDTRLSIKAAAIDLPAAGLDLRELNVTAHTGHDGLDLELEAASNRWKRARVKARIEYADLSARATVEADELAVLPDLPPARVRAQLRTDAKSAIEGEADIALGGLWREAKVKARLPATGAPRASAELAGVELAQALAVVRRKLPGLDFIESLDGRLSANVEVDLADEWSVQVHVAKSDAALKLVWLPWKISPTQARVSVTQKAVQVHGLHGTLGVSSYSDVAARVELGAPQRLSAASGRATLQLEQWFPWLRERVPQLEQITALSGAADVSLQRLALRFDRPAAADYEALVAPRQVSVTLKALPSPVAVAGGSVQVGPSRISLDKLAVALLDAKALVSGSVATKGPRIELSLAEGMVGEKLVQWALARAEVPPHLEPKTPLRFAAKRLAWAPGAPLEVDGSIDFDGGPALAAILAWQPGKLDLRRLAIKDARSDAVLGAATGGEVLQASFSGTLYGRSLASMLRKPLASAQGDLGVVRGKLLIKGHPKAPAQSAAEGRLQVEALDLSALAGARVLLQSGDFSADGESLRFTDARLEWEEQAVSLNGVLRRTPKGAVIDAKLESPGIVIDRLLPAEKPGAAPAPDQSMLAKLWQVPLPGRVELRAAFIQYKHYKIAPLEGTLVMDRERATLQVKEASMCGVSFPLSAAAAADSLTLTTQIMVKDQPMAQTMHCLTGEALDITGTADLRADLRTQGKPAELLKNLSGTAQGELRKGQIKQFALVGNILSVLSLRNLVSRDATLRDAGFPYRSLSAKGEFKNGGFLLEEGFLDSDAARIAVSGRIDLQGADSRLDVLVGMLNSVDRVVGAIPIIGDIFGNTMLALPISVTGDIRDPRVVPLGPRAVTDRMLGIFERTLKLPGKLVAPLDGGAAPPSSR